MSRSLAPFAILACLAGVQAQVPATANGVASFSTANVTFTLGGPATVNGATLTQSYDCEKVGANAATVPTNPLELGGRAAVLGDECKYVTLEGDGTTFYGGRVFPLGEWEQKEGGEVVLFSYPEDQNKEGSDTASGRASVTPGGEGATLDKLSVKIPAPGADTIIQARISAACNLAADGVYTYNAEDPTVTNGYLAPAVDGDEFGTTLIKNAAFATVAGIKGKYLQIGTLTSIDDGFTTQYCGQIIADVQTYGYVAASLLPTGNIKLEGWVQGLPTSTEGTFHMHAVQNDADTQRVYPDCTDSDTIGDHVLDSAQNDNFAQAEGVAVKYNSDALGVATLNNEVQPSAGASYTVKDLQYNAVVFHSAAAGNELQYELRMGCANLNTPPPFGGSAPNNPPVASSATATAASGVVAMAVAFVAARLA